MPLATQMHLGLFGARLFTKGLIYGCSNTKDLTLVRTGAGAAFAGDAVLYLKETPCENIILFGSCGSVGDLAIGDLIVPSLCYAKESFSELLLTESKEWPATYPDKGMLESFCRKETALRQGVCLTVGSLKLEEEGVESFRDRGVDVVDMECSAFFSASRFIKRKALSIFYVSDIIRSKPFYATLSAQDKIRLALSIKKAVEAVRRFVAMDLKGDQ